MSLQNQQNGSTAQDADVSTTTETTTVTQEDGSIVTTKTTHVTTKHKSGELKTVQKFYTYQDGALSPEEHDIDFIKRNSSKRRSLNKEAYVKLHRNTTNRKSIEVLKGRYETQPEGSDRTTDKVQVIKTKDYGTGKKRTDVKSHPNDAVVKELQSKLSSKLSKDTVESLKEKYSPSSFGYPNLDEVKLRKKPALPKKPKSLVLPNSPVRISTVSVGTIPVAQELKTIPGHEVILRSSSEDSIEKLESFMSEFTMDPKREVKEKKRTSSFRKILTGGLFSKDKKKNEKKHSEEKPKNKKTENIVVADNVQNEQAFNRNSIHRHTVDNHYTKQPVKASHDPKLQKEYTDSTINNLNETERRYAELHINQFNKLKATFSNPENFNKASTNNYQYLHENDNSTATIDRYIDTSSSSNTLESVDRGTYQNALIAQAELKQIKEKEMRAKQMDAMLSAKPAISPKKHENFVETPPRAKEMYQNVQLVKPKALIPINSERALPNPYHNGQDGRQLDDSKRSLEKNLNVDEKDYGTYVPIYSRQNNLNDVVYEYNSNKTQHQDQRQYSPNLTKSSNSSSTQNSPSSPSFSPRSSPRSPTLEGSKLRLPSNREKVNLQPRIKSPIPQPKVSTEKIIATELLKNKSETRKQGATPTPSPISQKVVSNYEEHILYEPKPVTAQIVRQSPVPILTRKPSDTSSVIDPFEAAKWHQKQRELAISPTLNDSSQVVTNVLVHADPEMKRNSLQYSSLPVTMRKASQDVMNMRQRPVTPVKKAPSIQSLQQSPQKHEMRQCVELYCWKEIQKLKEKQDQELKYQLQYTPYGYVEDPIIQRRSRSVEPAQQRNSKRSTSLPREVKPNLNSRIYYREPIPENRPIIYGEDDIYAQKNPEFLRNSPQRRTVSGTINPSQKPLQMYEGYYTNAGEVPYRPIFNRGSLNPQTQQDAQNQLLQKKVSFTGNRNPTQDSPWLARNGYVQNPPQRRMEKTMSVGDDEVFLRDSQIKQMNEQIQKQLIKDGQTPRESLMSLPRQQNLPEPLYGSRTDSVSAQNNNQVKYVNRLTHEKMNNEPTYVTRQNKQNITELTKQKQENLQNIYGTKQQPDVDPLYAGQIYQVRSQQLVPMQDVRDNGSIINESVNNSKAVALERYYTNNNLVVDSPYGSRRVVTSSPVTKVIKQVTVTNKVCDIYGNIHDNGKRVPVSPPSPAQIQQTGVIYGQLQGNVMGRPPQYQSYNQIVQPTNFVRGSRLTASANDMYKRYPIDVRRREVLYEESPYGQRVTNFNPNGPLPPTPNEQSKMQLLMMRRNNSNRGYPIISDTDSETSEVRRIMNRNYADEEEWNSDGKSGRGIPGSESGSGRGENDIEIRGRSRNARRDDPRRHTLAGDQQYGGMAGQGGSLARTMDLEGQPRGYPPMTNPMLFDDDPGIMSEVETSSTGFRRGGKQRSSLPVVRTPSKTLERPLGLVFLQYRNETKRALLPNEITSIDTVKALFVRSFPKQLTMEYLDSPQVKIYIHDSSKDMFYELEDLRSHLREIRDRSVLRLFESADVSGGLPMPGIGIIGGMGHAEDPSYFSEPEFDSEYQHQHIHKSKGSASKNAPYYMGSTASLPRSGLLRAYSPAVTSIPPERLKTLPTGAPPKPQRSYATGNRSSEGPPRPPERIAPFQRPANSLYTISDGYMSSPERGSRYEDPYYSQYTTRSGSITPVIDEEVSDTELLDESYSLYGVKLTTGGPRAAPRTGFPPPAAVPYDTTRIRVENMERQLANLTGLVQKALTQTPANLQVPGGRDNYRAGDEFDKNSTSSSTSLPDETFHRPDSKTPKLGKAGCHKSVSFEKSVSFSDEPPDMNSPKQHSPQHTADTKPPKPAIKSSTLPRTSSQERDRLKPAPPPKPASLSPGQYDGRHIYRDLQLTPEMYNQLRGLQKKAKDLRAEVRNLRRMSQAQAHSVRETIRDTFIKIRAMLLAGGEQVWQAGMDQERVRLSREEDLYKQEMLRLEKDLSELESTVEELRGNVINRKTRVNMSDVENMALILSKSSKTVADLKLRFPSLQDSMKSFLSSEMEKVVREEKFLKEEPERLENALRRCKKLTGTLVTLKRLASVQEQRLPCSTTPNDGRLSPSITETPPVTPTSAQHSKPTPTPRMGQVVIGGDSCNAADSAQRPENALDALLDELQTFSKPHPSTVNTQMPQLSYPETDPPTLPAKGIPPSHSSHFSHPPSMSEIGRKGSMDSATLLPTQNLTVSTATGSLRRLHSYPSGSDTDNSPPIQPLQRISQMENRSAIGKPPLPERNTDLLQHISGKRVPPPPPPRTSSKSPLASPTSPNLPPRSPATGLQHIQNVQNMVEKPQSQFEVATQNLGLGTLRRNVVNRSSVKDRAQTLPRNIGSNLQVHGDTENTISASNSSSCESVNSQDGTKKRKEELEQRHQELLKKQKALQEQYARLQQLQRGNNTLAVVPPAPDQLLKKTGSESNLLQKMGLQMSTPQMTGSLTNLPNTSTATNTNKTVGVETSIADPVHKNNTGDDSTASSTTSSTTTTSKVYETDIL